MILARLFDQYKKGMPGPCFGSWFSSFLAKLTIGTPRDRGLDGLLTALQASYFNRPADRRPPNDKLDEWYDGSKVVSALRVIEEPYAGKAAALGAITLVLLFVAIGVGVAKWRSSAAAVSPQVPAAAHAPSANGISGFIG